MANTFYNLPVPTSGGDVGAPVDISDLVFEKTVVVEGSQDTGILVLEVSTDEGATFVPLRSFTLLRDPLNAIVAGIFSHARVRRIAGQGAVSFVIGADSTEANVFANFTSPDSTSDGPILDTSAMPIVKTFNLVGSYQGGPVAILGSNDDVNFDPIVNFRSRGSESITAFGIYKSMRVRRAATAGTFTVSVGAGPRDSFPTNTVSGLLTYTGTITLPFEAEPLTTRIFTAGRDADTGNPVPVEFPACTLRNFRASINRTDDVGLAAVTITIRNDTAGVQATILQGSGGSEISYPENLDDEIEFEEGDRGYIICQTTAGGGGTIDVAIVLEAELT